MRAVAEKPHDAVVKFDTYRNVQRHRAVLPATARHLVTFVCMYCAVYLLSVPPSDLLQRPATDIVQLHWLHRIYLKLRCFPFHQIQRCDKQLNGSAMLRHWTVWL